MKYLYVDKNGHERQVEHRMLYSTGIVCITCNELMWRKPIMVGVNWGGLKPSQGEHGPKIKEMIEGAERRRETGERLKE